MVTPLFPKTIFRREKKNKEILSADTFHQMKVILSNGSNLLTQKKCSCCGHVCLNWLKMSGHAANPRTGQNDCQKIKDEGFHIRSSAETKHFE